MSQSKRISSRLRAALAKDQIDVDEMETLRAESVALVDKASKRGVQAVLDVSNVLSPEHRQKLVERMEQRRRRR